MRRFSVLVHWIAAAIVAAAFGSSSLLAQTAGGGAAPAAGGGGALGSSTPSPSSGLAPGSAGTVGSSENTLSGGNPGSTIPSVSGNLGTSASTSPQGASPGISPQTAQPLGQPNAPQTLQGPGAAASAMQGTIGAPGVVGGFFGVAQPLVTPAGPAPVALQPGPRPSGVDMPLTGENARQDTGPSGVAGAAAQRSFNAQAAESLNARTAQPAFQGQQRAAAVQPGRVEGWRFRWHDDLWWYYTPERSWVVWQGSRWVPYQRSALYARGSHALAGQPIASTAVPVTAGYRPDYLGSGMYSQATAAPVVNGNGQ